MPGIVGAVDFSGKADTVSIVAKACQLLNSRGAYRVCQHSYGFGLAIARVHRNVFNTDPQPFSDETSNVSVFLDGEIYLPEAVSHGSSSDQLRYVVDVYRRKGIDFASELNGSFVVAVVDTERNQLTVAVDRAASRPLFYARTASAFYFSPEIKAILPNDDIDNELDEAALASFLANGYQISDRTFFRAIRALEPGTAIAVDTKAASVDAHRYWEYSFDDNPVDKGEDEYIRELSQLTRQAVDRQANDGCRIAVLVSGGVDSRGILAYLLEKPQEINAVTWGETDNKKNSDAEVARELCQKLDVNHTFYRLDPSRLVENARQWVYETEGTVDALGNYPQGAEIFEELGSRFEVILRGDHSFGYSRGARDAIEGLARCRYVADSLGSRLKKIMRAEAYERLADQYRQEVSRVVAQCEAKDADSRRDYFRYYVSIFRELSALGHYKLRSIEQRCPLMDRDVLDLTMRLPSRYRINKELWIKTLRATFPELMRVRTATAGNLPDWDRHLRHNGELRDYVLKTLVGKHREDDGFFLLFDEEKLRAFLGAYMSDKPSSAALGSRLYSSLRSSRLLSSTPGRLLKRLLARYAAQALQLEPPMDVLVMRLLILKLWYDQFWPGPVKGQREREKERIPSK